MINVVGSNIPLYTLTKLEKQQRYLHRFAFHMDGDIYIRETQLMSCKQGMLFFICIKRDSGSFTIHNIYPYDSSKYSNSIRNILKKINWNDLKRLV